jgi:mevalonate kinase
MTGGDGDPGDERPVFAHGKVILLGEHAVVHGEPALAAAVDRGVAARGRVAQEPDATVDRLRVAPWGVDVAVGPGATPTPEPVRPLARAFQAILDGFSGTRPRVEVDVTVGIPGGAGLGCSAALGVAVLAAVEHALGQESSPATRAERSLAWERVFHGNPSGVDNAVAALGGVLWFRRGEPPAPVEVGAPLHLVVAHSGSAASTKTMVDGVAARLAGSEGPAAGRRVQEIGRLALEGRRAIEAGDPAALGPLLDQAQEALSFLGVSTDRLEALCAGARQAGALGAKLTGAGGGGCVIALAGGWEAAEAVRHRLVSDHGVAGDQAFVATVGALLGGSAA